MKKYCANRLSTDKPRLTPNIQILLLLILKRLKNEIIHTSQYILVSEKNYYSTMVVALIKWIMTDVAKGQKYYCIITNCKRFLTSAKIRKTDSALPKCLSSHRGDDGIDDVVVGGFLCHFWL